MNVGFCCAEISHVILKFGDNTFVTMGFLVVYGASVRTSVDTSLKRPSEAQRPHSSGGVGLCIP